MAKAILAILIGTVLGLVSSVIYHEIKLYKEHKRNNKFVKDYFDVNKRSD